MNSIFETFDINQKVEELETIDFNNQEIAILIPTFDESFRHIKKDDQALYWAQKRDATFLLHHLISQHDSISVSILEDADEANEIGIKFDHAILLHEFTEVEHSYVISSLQENNKNLQIIEIY